MEVEEQETAVATETVDEPEPSASETESETIEPETNTSVEGGELTVPDGETVNDVDDNDITPLNESATSTDTVASEVQTVSSGSGSTSSSDTSTETDATSEEQATSTTAAETNTSATSTASSTATSESESEVVADIASTTIDTTTDVTTEPVNDEQEAAPAEVESIETDESTNEDLATTSDKEIIYVLDQSTSDLNRHTFAEDECVSVGDGSYYCSQSSLSRQVEEDGVYAAQDQTGDHEIYLRKAGSVTQLTDNVYEDRSPYFDTQSKPWSFTAWLKDVSKSLKSMQMVLVRHSSQVIIRTTWSQFGQTVSPCGRNGLVMIGRL